MCEMENMGELIPLHKIYAEQLSIFHHPQILSIASVSTVDTKCSFVVQGLRFNKAHVTHPELKATFCLPIIGVKKNPSSSLYTTLGVITKGTVIEVNISELGLVTQSGKVIWGERIWQDCVYLLKTLLCINKEDSLCEATECCFLFCLKVVFCITQNLRIFLMFKKFTCKPLITAITSVCSRRFLYCRDHFLLYIFAKSRSLNCCLYVSFGQEASLLFECNGV